MARAPKAAPATGTAVVNWEDQMAQDAKAAEAQEASAGGAQFISVQGGQLSYGGNAMPNNEMAVVIVTSRLENVFYEGKYDPNNPSPPTCYAFGTDDKDMAPHPNVVAAGNAQNDTCTGCPMNEWGSADTGKGKACRNSRRLVLIPGGSFDRDNRFVAPDETVLREGQDAFMRLPVTSVKGYANFVKGVSAQMHRPPYGVFTRVKVTPDPATQFKVNFTVLDEVPRELIGVILDRRAVAEAVVETPYPDASEAPPPPPPRAARASKAAPKAPVRGRAGR